MDDILAFVWLATSTTTTAKEYIKYVHGVAKITAAAALLQALLPMLVVQFVLVFVPIVILSGKRVKISQLNIYTRKKIKIKICGGPMLKKYESK